MASSELMVPVGVWFVGLDQLVASRGALERTSRAADLRPSDFHRPEQLIPLRKAVAFHECAAIELGDPCLGLHYGQQISPTKLGVFAYVVLNAPSVESGIQNICRSKNLIVAPARVELVEREDMVELSYGIANPSIHPRRQDSEFGLSIGLSLLRGIIEPGWRPSEVHFEHGPPDDTSEHRRIFGCEPYFNRPSNALVFERHVLHRDVHRADPDLLALMEEQGQRLLEEVPDRDDLGSSVRSLISRALPHGDPNISGIARSLGMGTRTLQRRLREEGLVYSKLVDEVRRDLSERYLCDPSTSLTDVAFLLGYSELSAFHRAFRRWTGSTPLEYRRAALT